MQDTLLWLGRLFGISGALLVAVAAALRLAGRYWLGGFQAGTLLMAGVAAMVLGCLCLLAVLVERGRRS